MKLRGMTFPTHTTTTQRSGASSLRFADTQLLLQNLVVETVQPCFYVSDVVARAARVLRSSRVRTLAMAEGSACLRSASVSPNSHTVRLARRKRVVSSQANVASPASSEASQVHILPIQALRSRAYSACGPCFAHEPNTGLTSEHRQKVRQCSKTFHDEV